MVKLASEHSSKVDGAQAHSSLPKYVSQCYCLHMRHSGANAGYQVSDYNNKTQKGLFLFDMIVRL